jgi:hypothetical protein
MSRKQCNMEFAVGQRMPKKALIELTGSGNFRMLKPEVCQ